MHKRIVSLVPLELLEAARQAVAGRASDDLTTADLVRHGLAELAGIDVPPPPPAGWPKGKPRGPRNRQATAA
jgi:hypothetical protein